MIKTGIVAALSLAIAACATDGKDGEEGAAGQNGTDGAMGTMGTMGVPGPQLATPAVYTLTNAAGGNQVAAFVRASNGNLSRKGRFSTGGNGLGAGVGSQGSLVFDAKSQRFFAANAGDDTVSMLAIDADGVLTTLATVPSAGKRPVSVAVHGDLVYVVNQGDVTGAPVNPGIAGFQIQGTSLVAITDSMRPLSAASDVHPTDITFTPDGKYLLVAERLANKLDTFAIVNGVAQAGNFQASAGMQPFAFDFSPEGFLVVAEVGSGAANGSSASSYAITPSGTLTAITSALPTLQTAACWVVVAGGYAYMANAASANITGLVVSETGALSLHDTSGITATTGSGAIDLAVTPDRGFLYSLAGGSHTVNIFAINADGSLTGLPALPNVPASAVGLAAR